MSNELGKLVAHRVRSGDRRVLRTIRTWRSDIGRFQAFYFRSEICRGKAVPVYAILGIPAGTGPFPGVLHYHGGGQTANPELVDALVRQGYAAISFDWTGPTAGREHVTRWNGCTPRYAGLAPDESLLIRALTAARQALTILAEQPGVDPERLGEFGISWGGFQTWLLNAVDDRLRAAVAIYGCGITRFQAQTYLRFRDERGRERAFEPDAWMRLLNPIHYAHEQNAPVLFLNGTNDFFSWMNTFSRLAGQLDDRHQAAFAPHLNHGIGPLNPTLLAWFDHHLRGAGFPARPAVTGEWTRQGIKLRSVALPQAESATFHVAAMTGVGPDFFWRPVVAQRSGRCFAARMDPALLGARRVLVYAHQRFPRGVELSTFPLRLAGSPGRRPAPEAGTLPLTADLWYGPGPVDPLYPFTPLRQRVHQGRPGLECTTGPDLNFNFNTRVVAEPGRRLRAGAHFRCCLHGPVADPVTVAVLQQAGSPRERRFQGSFPCATLATGIPVGALKDSQGKALRPGIPLSHLYIGGTTQRPATVRLESADLVGRNDQTRPDR
jgi:dienelactone hydrolase